MNSPKWQNEFQPHPEDRFVSQKSSFAGSLIDRLFLKKYAIYCVSTLMVMGIIWYVIAPSVPGLDQELPVIESPPSPYKTKPVNQETDKELVQNKTIYEKLSAKKPDEKVEHLLQEPEEPMAPPPTLSAEFIGNLMNEDLASEGTVNELDFPKEATAPLKTSESVDGEPQRALKTFFQETELEEVPASHPQDKEKKAWSEEERAEKPLAVTVTGSSVKPKSASNIPPALSGQTATHWIQLASVKTKEAAEREWKRLNSLSKLKPLLASFEPIYGSVDMGEGEGIHHRLRIGLLSYKDAKNLCAKLRDLKVDCIVKKNQ